jgi:hypothetical protein
VLLAVLVGSWIVDDAGISYARARNLAHGHGLVAQTGHLFKDWSRREKTLWISYVARDLVVANT